jgi:hypothetical protein
VAEIFKEILYDKYMIVDERIFSGSVGYSTLSHKQENASRADMCV